jgi:hypothetical protein
MAGAFDGGGDGRKGGGGGKERLNNQIEATVAAGGNNSRAMAFDGDGNGAARWQQDDCENLVEGGGHDGSELQR